MGDPSTVVHLRMRSVAHLFSSVGIVGNVARFVSPKCGHWIALKYGEREGFDPLPLEGTGDGPVATNPSRCPNGW